jgi:hypothetical protein
LVKPFLVSGFWFLVSGFWFLVSGFSFPVGHGATFLDVSDLFTAALPKGNNYLSRPNDLFSASTRWP